MAPPLNDDDEILNLATADDVAAAVERLYGAALETPGLLHPIAVWQGDRGRHIALADRRETPGSHHGTFVRSLARARADAVLTSGALLCRNPAEDLCLAGPGHLSRALGAWRREHLGKNHAPITLVLTSHRDLDLRHPVFSHSTRPVVYTNREVQWQLESRAADHGVEVVGADEATAAGAVDFLRHAFGAATIALETGPLAIDELYGPPSAIDEVLLCLYRGAHVEAVLGDRYLSAEQLTRLFAERTRPYRVAAANGEWSLQRLRR